MEPESYAGDAAVGADYDDDFDDESSSDDDGSLPADRYLDRELSWLTTCRSSSG
jgi:polyphosphate kinase